ncbi:MAG: hypothetical protein EPO68_02225 [Planctomycetota bacterium]|nr:MAG: hypothetical protein EPO68_02225 [Planctomycetota bacterium]
MIAALDRPLLQRPLSARPAQPLRAALAPALQPGALPLAARSAILCAACLWVGLLTLELVADNHERALALHERQRDLVAREAINQRLSFLAESHVPGVGTQAPPAAIEGVRTPTSKVARQTLAKASVAAPPAAKSGKGGKPASAQGKPSAAKGPSKSPSKAPAHKPAAQPQRSRSGVL